MHRRRLLAIVLLLPSVGTEAKSFSAKAQQRCVLEDQHKAPWQSDSPLAAGAAAVPYHFHVWATHNGLPQIILIQYAMTATARYGLAHGLV